MRRAGGRLQTVGAGMLVLAVTVAAPALSAAQQEGSEPATAPGDPALTDPGSQPGQEGEPGAAEQPEQVAAEAGVEAAAPPLPSTAPTQRNANAKASAAETISVGDNFYLPAKVKINVGDTITWKNDGSADHTATAEDQSFNTGTFKPGQSRSETFTTAGTISYFCEIHGTAQSGTIQVLASSSGGGGGGGGGAGSSGTSEAAAVSSAGAAGSSSSLPATGFAAIGLGMLGLLLLGAGSLIKHLESHRGDSQTSLP